MDNGKVINIGSGVLDSNVYYSVTKNLTNCTISNSATTAIGGQSYSATITPNDGYKLSTVTVTMGGSTVSVSGGNINIANVTGNIVITAVAEVVQTGPTNLLPLSIDADGSQFVGTHANGGDGYEYNYRINSSGQKVAYNNVYCTGFMPVTLNDTIRIKNITEFTTDASRNQIRFYDASKTHLGGTTLLVANSEMTVENGVYSCKPKQFASGSVAFFRFSCGKITDDTIVTVNEEIV